MAQTEQEEILKDRDMETDHQSAKEEDTMAGAFEAESKAAAEAGQKAVEAETEQRAKTEAETAGQPFGGEEGADDQAAGGETEASGQTAEDEADTDACGGSDIHGDSADSQEVQGDGQEPKEGEPRIRNPFKRKEKKDKAAEQIEELNDRIRRQMAEFDNFRKRTEREKSQMFEVGAKSIIEKILPVVDNFERGLAAVPPEGREDPFVQGMDKIYKQLMTELENVGVKPIAAVGEEFNPDFHNAVMQVENEELKSGTVAQELQKGYLYRDSVVRHSMVAVVQ